LIKDIELQTNLYILWDTLINPIFNTSQYWITLIINNRLD
jgi:hypothetical protein